MSERVKQRVSDEDLQRFIDWAQGSLEYRDIMPEGVVKRLEFQLDIARDLSELREEMEFQLDIARDLSELREENERELREENERLRKEK